MGIQYKEQSLVVARGNSGLEIYDNGIHRRLATAQLRGGRSVNFALDSSTIWSIGVPFYGDGCRSQPSDSIKITILPRNSPPPPLITVIGDTFFCTKARATLIGPNGYVDYRWTGSNSFFGYEQKIVVTPTFTTGYNLIVTDSFGCQSFASSKIIQVIGIYQPNSFLFQGQLQTDIADSYQWFLNGVPLMDSVKRTMRPSANGFYTVQVTRNGCKSLMSVPINVLRTAIPHLADNQRFDVSPNPMNDILRLYTEGVENGFIEVTDVLGRLVVQLQMKTGEDILPVANWQTGVYFVHLKTVKGTSLAIRRVVKF